MRKIANLKKGEKIQKVVVLPKSIEEEIEKRIEEKRKKGLKKYPNAPKKTTKIGASGCKKTVIKSVSKHYKYWVCDYL